jgi:hypothetical protein
MLSVRALLSSSFRLLLATLSGIQFSYDIAPAHERWAAKYIAKHSGNSPTTAVVARATERIPYQDRGPFHVPSFYNNFEVGCGITAMLAFTMYDTLAVDQLIDNARHAMVLCVRARLQLVRVKYFRSQQVREFNDAVRITPYPHVPSDPELIWHTDS